MIVSKKLRDLTEAEWREHRNNGDICDYSEEGCLSCPLRFVFCETKETYKKGLTEEREKACSWFYNKEMFSNSFLDKEVKFLEEVISYEEKKYLMLSVFQIKDRVLYFTKIHPTDVSKKKLARKLAQICITIIGCDKTIPEEKIYLPVFNKNEKFTGMSFDEKYTFEDLAMTTYDFKSKFNRDMYSEFDSLKWMGIFDDKR